MILMLEGKQRFINTDHLVTAYVTGREDHCQIILRMVNEEIPVSQYYKSFNEAERSLHRLASALADDITWAELQKDGVRR